MIRKIVLLHNPVLKKKSAPIEKIDDAVRTLAADMFDTMYAANGIGLAAIQVGEPRRMFVADIPEITKEPMVFINPVIRESSKSKMVYEEGCLSIPGVKYKIGRPKKVVLEFLDLEGKKQEMELQDLFAICVQHEIDHLDGILFIERAGLKARKAINELLEEKDIKPYFKV